jgi:hypothetical protein
MLVIAMISMILSLRALGVSISRQRFATPGTTPDLAPLLIHNFHQGFSVTDKSAGEMDQFTLVEFSLCRQLEGMKLTKQWWSDGEMPGSHDVVGLPKHRQSRSQT